MTQNDTFYCIYMSIYKTVRTYTSIVIGCIAYWHMLIIVSTGGMRWILWFSVSYAAATRREIFGVNTLRGKLHYLGSPNLQDIFIGG